MRVGTAEAAGMQTPSLCFARPVPFLTVHATTGMNAFFFFCGFPSVNS